MLQNRVDPFGHLIRTSARGAWMGNRGLLHDEHQEIRRPFKLKAWITCKLEFKGWHRKVMTPNRYTELFFLDEATAFSAGHRPCFECRREDALAFRRAWTRGNPEYGFDEKTAIGKIDDILHNERMQGAHEESNDHIPDGVFLLWQGDPYVFRRSQIARWTPFGYDTPVDKPQTEKITLLTPGSIVNAYRAGYVPQMNGHPLRQDHPDGDIDVDQVNG
jgi:hypothetical protein